MWPFRLCMMAAGLFLLALYVAGCASLKPAPQVICLPIKSYSADEQKDLAAAVQALPDGSILLRVVMDYGAMRDATRACRAASR